MIGDVVVRAQASTLTRLRSEIELLPQPFSDGVPRADIYELISPDILHQVIKGTFKDHIVTWNDQYLTLTHGNRRAKAIMDIIDKRWAISVRKLVCSTNSSCRISVVPSFSGLRRFPKGRDFKQWTGDDSRALMKVRYAACL